MSNAKLKPLDQQVIVITGASSGIGLATAMAAAEKGARVVLAARSEGALKDIVGRIAARGGEAVAVKCDVGDREQIEKVVSTAITRFGRIDTWVNNAGTSIYGRLDEVSDKDNRQLFETNFWGVCNGSLAALPHILKSGGALINVGSEISEGSAPLLGIYGASKHAVKGFTDALRIELEEHDKAPISITLIQPTAVDTPFPQHAKNYMDKEPKLPTPMIKPEKVAEAILDAATKPVRAVKVGLMAKVNTMMENNLPSIAEKMAAKQYNRVQYNEPPRHPEGALYAASETTTVVGQMYGPGGVEEKA